MPPISDVTRHLLIINVILFLAGFVIDTNMLALYFPLSSSFQPYQILTHMFMHGGFIHLFFNMFALVSFGSLLETVWGPKRFMFFYFFCGLGAAAVMTFVHYLDYEKVKLFSDYTPDLIDQLFPPMVGASGAIYGLLAAFAVLFPEATIALMFIPIPMKAKYIVPIFIILEFILGKGSFSGDNVAHFAHFGGAIFGLILVLIWRKRGLGNNKGRWN
jgi:membrane associated rhomboid family serine protease